jgi:hypothetical protein
MTELDELPEIDYDMESESFQEVEACAPIRSLPVV